MTDAPAGSSATGRKEETARRMRAIVAELTAAGLIARLNETRGALDVTATLERAGCKSVEVIVDDDGYVQISFWNDPAATPAQVVAVINRALTAITTATVSRLRRTR